jgi:hypothetical protein
VFLTSCKDVIEPNLAHESLSINSPGDNDTLSGSNTTFWWNILKDANKYELQIVKPDFTNIQTLIVDSSTTNDKFYRSLSPGKYQWRIRAVNGSSNTSWYTRTLWIDSTQNLSNQTVQLIVPLNNATQYTLAITFSWYQLAAATSYNLQIVNQSSGSTVDLITNITSTAYNYTFLNYGSYKWKVWADNVSSVSLPSSWNVLTVEIQPPSLLTPNNGDSLVSATVPLVWSRYSPATGDSLYIYPDSLVSAPLISLYTAATTYSFAGTLHNDYFWRIKSLDAAGNKSSFSTIRKFIVK